MSDMDRRSSTDWGERQQDTAGSTERERTLPERLRASAEGYLTGAPESRLLREAASALETIANLAGGGDGTAPLERLRAAWKRALEAERLLERERAHSRSALAARHAERAQLGDELRTARERAATAERERDELATKAATLELRLKDLTAQRDQLQRRGERAKAAITEACELIARGADRALASLRPAGGQPPNLTLDEWRRLYEVLDAARTPAAPRAGGDE